jgi:hypothetical protein
MQKAFKKYMGGGQKMREQGRLTGSNKLTDGAGPVLRGNSPLHVTDGPYTEGKEVLGPRHDCSAPGARKTTDLGTASALALPAPQELGKCLDSFLEGIYLLFNEG